MTKPPAQPLSQRVAPPPVSTHLSAAVEAIDAQFGDGYAAKHPELVASLVQAGAIHSATTAALGAHEEALAALHSVSAATNETLLKLKPKLFG